MNRRWWIVVGMALSVGGCAESVDDPLPPGPTAPEQAPPSSSTLAGDLENTPSTTVDFTAPPLLVQEPSLRPMPEPGSPEN